MCAGGMRSITYFSQKQQVLLGKGVMGRCSSSNNDSVRNVLCHLVVFLAVLFLWGAQASSRDHFSILPYSFDGADVNKADSHFLRSPSEASEFAARKRDLEMGIPSPRSPRSPRPPTRPATASMAPHRPQVQLCYTPPPLITFHQGTSHLLGDDIEQDHSVTSSPPHQFQSTKSAAYIVQLLRLNNLGFRTLSITSMLH